MYGLAKKRIKLHFKARGIKSFPGKDKCERKKEMRTFFFPSDRWLAELSEREKYTVCFFKLPSSLSELKAGETKVF